MERSKEIAKIYSTGVSSSEFLIKIHERDFLAGYNEAVKDYKPVLDILNNIHILLEEYQPDFYISKHHNEIIELNKRLNP